MLPFYCGQPDGGETKMALMPLLLGY